MREVQNLCHTHATDGRALSLSPWRNATWRPSNRAKAAVLGHSHGGCLALQYVLRYPHHLTHLLLVGTTAAWDYTDHIVFEQSGHYPFVEEVEAFR
jgi:pimeloyl-ACP methyl ester carboxylesterase